MKRELSATGRSCLLVLACLITGISAGCNSDSPPQMSPTPEQDPKLYEAAREANEKAKERNREAEKLLMKRRGGAALPVK